MAKAKNDHVELTSESSRPEDVRTGILVIGAFTEGALPTPSQRVDAASKGRLSAVLKRGDLDEKAGSSLLLHDLPGVEADRVLVVNLGKRTEFGDKAFRDAVSAARTDNKNSVLMRVKSGGSSRFVAVPVAKG